MSQCCNFESGLEHLMQILLWTLMAPPTASLKIKRCLAEGKAESLCKLCLFLCMDFGWKYILSITRRKSLLASSGIYSCWFLSPDNPVPLRSVSESSKSKWTNKWEKNCQNNNSIHKQCQRNSQFLLLSTKGQLPIVDYKRDTFSGDTYYCWNTWKVQFLIAKPFSYISCKIYFL